MPRLLLGTLLSKNNRYSLLYKPDTLTMAYYRKKPITIEAVQLCWENWSEVCFIANVGKLSEGKPEGCYVGADGRALPDGETSEVIGLQIPTLEGVMLGTQGDYIIRGVVGEIYPCKPEIFNMLYSEAKNDPTYH